MNGNPSDAAILRGELEAAVDALVDADERVACAAAARCAALDRVRILHEQLHAASPTGVVFRSSDEIAARSLRAEVACALRIGEREAESRLAEARTVVHDLPELSVAFAAGSVSERHVRVMVDEVAGLEDVQRLDLDRRVTPVAVRSSSTVFRRHLRRARDQLAPESMPARHRAALGERTTWLDIGRDGMADFAVRGSAVEVAAIDDRIHRIAAAQRRVDGETRTMRQLRSDAAVTLLLGGIGVRRSMPATVPGSVDAVAPRSDDLVVSDSVVPVAPDWAAEVFDIRPTVHLTVPVLALIGAGAREPVDLAGVGPIDPVTAARWCARAPSFTRLLTDPVSGALLALDRTKYRPTDDQRAWLRSRDVTCRFPGCGQLAHRCEIDHTAEWVADAGRTDDANLASLCIGHHTLKTATEWTSAQHPDGTLDWTSPLGRRYTTTPGRGVGPPASGPPGRDTGMGGPGVGPLGDGPPGDAQPGVGPLGDGPPVGRRSLADRFSVVEVPVDPYPPVPPDARFHESPEPPPLPKGALPDFDDHPVDDHGYDADYLDPAC